MAMETGIKPHEFDDMTHVELVLWINAARERRNQGIVDRIIAIGRALSRKGDPFEGLIERPKQMVGGWKGAAQHLFWKKIDRE